MDADSTGMPQANPFWDYSLALYRQPGVAGQCLALQDGCGLDVNLLLYACYAAACGIALSGDDVRTVDESVSGWRRDMVRPLRELRRRAGESPEAVALREQLLQAELSAERLQQDRMWAGRSPAGRWYETPSMDAVALAQNLERLADLGGFSVNEFAELLALVERLPPAVVAQE